MRESDVLAKAFQGVSDALSELGQLHRQREIVAAAEEERWIAVPRASDSSGSDNEGGGWEDDDEEAYAAMTATAADWTTDQEWSMDAVCGSRSGILGVRDTQCGRDECALL
ncbi:hypothetical protein LTR08_000956 [Meristemomyces frigidus]|nr:hypothetical protein LTR08_000956 [Meristemomyces frigidus]